MPALASATLAAVWEGCAAPICSAVLMLLGIFSLDVAAPLGFAAAASAVYALADVATAATSVSAADAGVAVS